MAATTDIYGNQTVSTGTTSVKQPAPKINPVTGLPVTAADRSQLNPMAQPKPQINQNAVFNVPNTPTTPTNDTTMPNFRDLQDGIWDRTNRQADILRTQAKTAATDQAGQAGLLAGSQGARRLQNNMLDQQATGIGNLMDIASGASAQLGRDEIARNDDQIANLLAMAEGNPELQAHILQGQGAGSSFSDLMGSIYDSESGELNSQFAPASLIERVRSGEVLTNPEEIIQFQSEMDQLGIDKVGALGLEGNDYVAGMMNDQRLGNLINDKGGYGDISGEDWQAIMSDPEMAKLMETNIGETDFKDGMEIDTGNFTNRNLNRRLAEKGVAPGKVIVLNGQKLAIQSITYAKSGAVDEEAVATITAMDIERGEPVTLTGNFD